MITIISGGDSVEITVTQRGTGEPEEPEDPENPTRPEVAPENRLTLVEKTFSYTTNESEDGRPSKSFIALKYDAQSRPTSVVYNKLATGDTDMLDATSNMTINWGAEKITMDCKDLYINPLNNSTDTDEEQLLYGYKDEYTEEFLRNKDGLVSFHTDLDGNKTEYTYNADKTLKSTKRMRHNGSEVKEETTTYTWNDGNITRMVNTRGSSTNETTFTYTEHPNPWQGVDMAILCSDNIGDIAMLFGIGGLSMKNLPATVQKSYGTTRFEYTFDVQGRLSTMVSTYTPSSSKSSERSESKFHYGEVTVPSYPTIPYVTKQEVTEKGTLNYTFDKENPNEHFVAANEYTSFVKIHSTLTDGSTRDQTIYARIYIPNPMSESGPLLPNLPVNQQQVDNFRLTGYTLTEDYMDENVINHHRFTFTLNYNCFSVDLKCDLIYPDYQIYSATTGSMERRLMPVRPFTKECIIVHQPVIELMSEEEGTYEFIQLFAVQVNPSAESAFTDEIRRTLTTKTR